MYGNSIGSSDHVNLIPGFDNAGTVNGWREIARVDKNVVRNLKRRDLVTMQAVEDPLGGNGGDERLLKALNVAYIVDVRMGHALLWRWRSPIPEYRPGICVGNPQNELVALDIVGHGAAWEVGARQVVKPAMWSARRSSMGCPAAIYVHTACAGGTRAPCLSLHRTYPLGQGGR